jgi:DNA polymerase-3 subunit beta
MNIIITKELNAKLKALLCFAGSKDIRDYLNGVCVDVSGGVLRGVATNGHMAGVAAFNLVTGVPDAQYVLPREFVEHIVKTKYIYTLDIVGDTVTASHGHSAKLVDGKFPDWRRVVQFPEGEESAGTYNAEYLHDIAKASKALGNKHGLYKLHQFGESAGVFQIAGDFVGVIMPLNRRTVGTISRDEFNAVRGA